jgi:hypothetical protein
VWVNLARGSAWLSLLVIEDVSGGLLVGLLFSGWFSVWCGDKVEVVGGGKCSAGCGRGLCNSFGQLGAEIWC